MSDIISHRGVAEGTGMFPAVHAVGRDRPLEWLKAGWHDFLAAPAIGLAYGALAVVSSYFVVFGLALSGYHYLVLPAAAGFMIVGPALVVGIYEASRLMQAGERPTLLRVAFAFRRNPGQIAAMGLALLMLFFAWIRWAFILFMMFFSMNPPPLDQIVTRIFFSAESLPFLLTGTVVGAVLATAVFMLSVVAIPMLLDRDTNVFTAMFTSAKAVYHNIPAMLLWAAVLAGMIGLSFLTGFLGLLVVLPVLGHATWHCYRDLVARS
ncbi:DUF2189 domain-containing protein [Azospirillum thermophilum]|uniref:DUF2189 domain-containing protein n=1 Tax=Azospirillum thermophilum TaxID=2202148 RepID=A0A2S2CKP5_9PROT|nr:DUF2189 domain-containing protein [Azospirillum thermophilum]AWK84999.1 hypothetical protein DEW08_01320 [Azospirillum thermophilum]